ncbi:MAG TPA: hypothetical protein VM866_07600 [Pyrinomonadaceae bacterium]|jgi:hypothetical protein|nr:hypothetical protein [Pyrinomonadaceae bacterium]
MHSQFLHHTEPTRRRLVALTLVLWLGGAGCVVGCEMMPRVFASDPTPLSDSTASCPARSGPDCCHQQNSNRVVTSFGTTPQTPRAPACCPLAGQAAEAPHKIRFGGKPLIVIVDRLLLASSIAAEKAAWTTAQTRVPDRGGTYLRCCVFLI